MRAVWPTTINGQSLSGSTGTMETQLPSIQESMFEVSKILAGSAQIRADLVSCRSYFHVNFDEYFITIAKCLNFSLRNKKSRVRGVMVSLQSYSFSC